MTYNISTEDLRSIKTERALHGAMFSLLENHSFKKITVKGICEESLISRAAFYAHFVDKYDLLKHWLLHVWTKNTDGGDIMRKLESIFDSDNQKPLKIMKNLLYEADNETFEIIFNFLITTADLSLAKNCDKDLYAKNIVLSTFFGGGIIAYFLWQVKNRFSPDIPMINNYFESIIKEFKDLKNNKL